MKKLFVSIPISSIWCWWRERKRRQLAAENERIRQISRAYLEATSPVNWGVIRDAERIAKARVDRGLV